MQEVDFRLRPKVMSETEYKPELTKDQLKKMAEILRHNGYMCVKKSQQRRKKR